MSLFIKKAKYKNGKVYCSIVDGYRINGKVKQTVVRNYGYYSDLKSKYNNVVSFLKNELEILKYIINNNKKILQFKVELEDFF